MRKSHALSLAVNSLYAQDEWSVGKDLTIKFGLRYDKYQNSDEIVFNPYFTARNGFSNQENLDGKDLFLPRLGFHWAATDRLTLYGGAARNASTWVQESETLASWDLVDVTTGVSLNRGRSRLALGLGYAWGTGDLVRTIVPPDTTGPAPATEARFSRWTISLGASLGGGSR
jgi:hypothetical protein